MEILFYGNVQKKREINSLILTCPKCGTKFKCSKDDTERLYNKYFESKCFNTIFCPLDDCETEIYVDENFWYDSNPENYISKIYNKHIFIVEKSLKESFLKRFIKYCAY